MGFFGEDKSLIYSELEGFDPSFLEDLSEDAHVYQFLDSPEGGSILVGSLVQWENSVTFQWKGAGASTDGDSWVRGVFSSWAKFATKSSFSCAAWDSSPIFPSTAAAIWLKLSARTPISSLPPRGSLSS